MKEEKCTEEGEEDGREEEENGEGDRAQECTTSQVRVMPSSRHVCIRSFSSVDVHARRWQT